MRRVLAIWLLLGVIPTVSADVLDDAFAFQSTINAALIDAIGERWTGETAADLREGAAAFAPTLTVTRPLWPEPPPLPDAVAGARWAATLQARLQHVSALEMLAALDRGEIGQARAWRAIIALPKYANALEGAMALQQLGSNTSQREEVGRLLTREYFLWQITRAREKVDELSRLVATGRQTPALLASRVSAIEELSRFPESLTRTLDLPPSEVPESPLPALLSASDPASLLARWRAQLAAGYPNLLTEDDVASRERIVLKLLRLIPIEYQSGVRDGEIVIPIEYREAVNFTVHARRILAELAPVWRQSQPEAMAESGARLNALFDTLETTIAEQKPLAQVRRDTSTILELLDTDFGLSRKRSGSGGDVVVEASLEVRSLLGKSLAAALAGKWRQAEALRLEAYINFDLDIEMRVLPRDPALAIRAEKAFLDGGENEPGIKAALDARLDAAGLEAAYQRALNLMDESVALCRVGLAPASATLSATLIVVREGLEAVVILAALLAGLRGVENAPTRRRIGMGAWLALLASAALFVVSRTLLSGLSRYGELLEAVIAILAVIILLMVTNWVFHKFYWTGWNARLRQLSKAATRPKSAWMESFALVGVGFMTIFREGFETTLFMQSLILEAGMGPVLMGLAIGGALIAAMGFVVFFLGAKLPYRKMLVVTGLLVVFVLFTFVGSTVRILQTIGWLPIHPVPGLHLPTWTGVWFGIYPTLEGILLPALVFVYVGGAWLWVRAGSRRARRRAEREEAALRMSESRESVTA